MARKLRSDSATSKANTFSQAQTPIPVPQGIVLDGADEQMLWNQFSKTRSHDSWRDFDLVLLAKIVKLETKIRKYTKQLDEDGVVIESRLGAPMENPLCRITDVLLRQQLAIIRSIGLNQAKSPPRVLNATGDGVKFAEKILKGLDDELIPRLRAVN